MLATLLAAMLSMLAMLLAAAAAAETTLRRRLPLLRVRRRSGDAATADEGAAASDLSSHADRERELRRYTEHALPEEANGSWWIPALKLAAGRNHQDVVKLLVAGGADKAAKDMYGHTAKHYAEQNKHHETARLLDHDEL